MNSDIRLSLIDVWKRYGGIVALRGVGLVAKRGEIVGIIGPNGAGKSTLLDVVGGFVSADAGAVLVEGEYVTGVAAHRRAEAGVRRTFQQARLFGRLTVEQNVRLGRASIRATCGIISALVRRDWGSEEAGVPLAERVKLQAMGLMEKAMADADTLSYGQMRLLEFARSTVSQPVLLLLDEPVAGVFGGFRRTLVAQMDELARGGTTILFVEHDLEFVRRVAERVIVMDRGSILLDGGTAQVMTDELIDKLLVGSAGERSQC